jgi:hypothetical protein
MKRDTHTVDKFYIKGLTQRRIVFQLILDKDGRYEIKRDSCTLLFFSKEQQARKGFETLKERRR